jgi:hypothetical protein
VRKDVGYSPKPRIDKLGVKPGMRVAVLGLSDPDFFEELRARTEDVSTRRRARCDLIFAAFEDRAGLARLGSHRDFIVPDGAIWAVWPKGSKDGNENDVRDAALAVGLVDVKVVAFSPTHSALKLVIPVAKRRS